MKRTIAIIAVIALCQVFAFGQKKYEMVIDKTDDTKIVLNVEDIVRAYFREFNMNYNTCPDNNHPHLIDLGLPSGTKWACCNVGASKPEGYGNYFSWGETQQKGFFEWSTYIHCDGSYNTCHDIGSDIAGTKYDAATANWGAPWQMPSRQQCKELIDNCTCLRTTENGVNGRRFIGPNGSAVFIPAAGDRWTNESYRTGSNGLYWTSSLYAPYTYNAWDFFFNPEGVSTTDYGRAYGRTVRPVTSSDALSPTFNVTTLTATDISVTSATLNGSVTANNTNKSYVAGFFLSTTSNSPSSTDNTLNVTCSSSSPVGNFSASATGLTSGTKYNYRAYVLYDGKCYYGDTNSFTTSSSASNISCPDGNHPHMIDLGLPSGTKWACCNVGASKPEGYGNYYAWGETKPKSVYEWDTYQYGSYYEAGFRYLGYIGAEIAGTQYDAATVNWGAPWRMPSTEQCIELINNCTSVWTTENGVNGRKFTGPNGSTIFLPAAGYFLESWSWDTSWGGFYWPSTLVVGSPNYVRLFGFSSSHVVADNDLVIRFQGHSVRPVRKN